MDFDLKNFVFFSDFESLGDLNILSEQKRRIDEEIMRANHELSNITERNWNFQLKVQIKTSFYFL